MILFHPRHATLLRYAEDDAHRPRGVRRHLESCARCRAVVTEIRGILAGASAIEPVHFDTDALWSRIHARQRLGERSLLPATSASARRPRRYLARGGVAAAAAALLAYALFSSGSELQAGVSSGTLIADTLRAQPGSAISVRYIAPPAMASDANVVARITYLGEPPRTRPVDTLVTLSRTREGVFGGMLRIPEAAMVTRLTIESADGKATDDNHGRAWEIVSRDTAGRPLFLALFTQFASRGMGEWEKGYHIVKEMVRHYPDEPKGWRFHASQSLELAGPPGRDSVRAVFRPQYARLHAMYAAQPADSERAWEMSMFGSTIADTARSRFWRRRLLAEHPASPGATQFRVWDITESTPDPRRRIAAFDSLYAISGSAAAQLMYDAFSTAVTTGDSAIVARWGDRVLQGSRKAR
ncbi:MAG: hypothetical protein H0X64_14235 [Gemmatimonadaceae bacterium]|nr:hypothetical protein [Gemmatimonadaceae bacterium]